MTSTMTRMPRRQLRRAAGRLGRFFARTRAVRRRAALDRSAVAFENMEPRVLLSGDGVGDGPRDHAQGPPDAVVAELNAGDNAAVQHSIQDFVDAQGTFELIDPVTGEEIIFVPPLANFLGWSDPAQDLFASVDYAGIADAYANGAFGTEFAGSVIERPLGDGTSEIHVQLHTTNALTWVITGSDFANGPLVLGNRVTDVLDDGAGPVLGDSKLDFKFNNPTGAPLPDIMEVVFTRFGDIKQLKFQATAGGSEGDVKITEVGLFNTGFKGNVADGFPVEKIKLRLNDAADESGVASEPAALETSATSAENGAVQRSIDEFVAAQSTHCPFGDPGCPFPQVPPLADFVGWTDVQNFLGISVDYAGIAAEYLKDNGIDLGTSFSGSVTERPLADGTAEIHIRLHTTNALTFAIQGSAENGWDFGSDPLVLGARATDVVAGAAPALGDSLLTATLIAPEPGLALPDLFGVFFGGLPYGVKQVKFQANAQGLLADGTPGRAHTSQAGIFNSHNFPNGHDGFPVERIDVGAIKGAMAQWLADQGDDDAADLPALTLVELE